MRATIRETGFTLIEILLAIFILGIVLSTVYASFTGTFRIIRETEHGAEMYDMARNALDRMARDLESTAAWGKTLTFKTKTYTLGEREFVRLIFRAAAHAAFSERDLPGAITVIEYSVDEDKERGGYTLSRSDSRFRDAQKDEETPGGYLVCDRIKELTYVFFDKEGKEYDSWNSEGDEQKNKAPAEVMIRLSLENPTDPEHPYLFTTRVRIPYNSLVTS